MNDWDGIDRRAPPDRERWRLTKDISMADVLSIVLAGSAMLFAYTKLSERTALLESAVAEIRAVRQDEKQALAGRLDRLEDKLDRLIERMGHKR